MAVSRTPPVAKQDNTRLRQSTLKPPPPAQRSSLSKPSAPARKTQVERETEESAAFDEAVKYLIDNEYYTTTSPLTIITISDIIMKMHDKPSLGGHRHILDGLKYISVILKELANETAVQSLWGDKIEKAMKQAREETMRELKTQREELGVWRDVAAGGEKRRGEAVDKLVEGVKELSERVTGLEGVARHQPPLVQEQSPQLLPPPHQMGATNNKETYTRATVNRITAKKHASTQARNEDAERQIILSTKNQKENEVAAGLKTEAELLAKAEMMLKLMAEEGESPPTHAEFIGGFRTRTGAIIYTLNTSKAAKWIKSPDILWLFKEKYGGSAEARSKHFNVLALYVPITFDPDLDAAKRQVEADNRLRKGSLAHARYIKPVQKRSPNQKVAHVILGFETRSDVNAAIARAWISIGGRRVTAEKLIGEPRRCFKCQNVKGNHMADRCPEKNPKCARCAGEHYTD